MLVSQRSKTKAVYGVEIFLIGSRFLLRFFALVYNDFSLNELAFLKTPSSHEQKYLSLNQYCYINH